MKTKIIFLLLLASFIFLSAYEREQVSRYAHRYTRLTEGFDYGYSPDSLWWNVNPFIYDLEVSKGANAYTEAGYYDGADCAHFVSQNLQTGGIPMYENGYYDNPHFLGYINCKNLHNFAVDHLNRREDNFFMTFQNNFWMDEIIDPVIESEHPYPPYSFFYDGIDLSCDVYFAKFRFPAIGTSYEDLVKFNIGPTTVYQVSGFYTDHWSTLVFNESGGLYNPIDYMGITLQDQWPNNGGGYGFSMDRIKWQAHYEPQPGYTNGDFQIFCNYRTDSLYFDNDYEIFYENTYNDTGRTIRYRHATICRSGSGNTARVSAHNLDRCDSLWSYAYCEDNAVYDSLSFNSITHYQLNDGTGELPNLCAYNNWETKSIITTSDPDSTTNIDYFEAGEPVYIKYAFQNNGSVMIPDRFKVKIEYQNARTVFDSVLYNGIFADSLIIESLDDPLIMPEIDSLTINVILDAGQNQDFGGDWEATWNDQNWQEDFESDNIISKTIYLDTGLQPPSNLQLNLNPSNDTINLQWDGNDRSIYRVYSSSNPYNGFEEDLTGTYSINSWSAPLPTENRFYYVVETDERYGRKSNTLHLKKFKRNVNRY